MFGKNLQQSIADQSLNRKKFLFVQHRQPYFWNDIPQTYSDKLIISLKWYHEEHIVNNSIARKDTPPAMSQIFMRVFLALLFQKLDLIPNNHKQISIFKVLPSFAWH